MANKYYDSGSLGATTPFETPETASTTLSAALDVAILGEAIYVKNTSNETITLASNTTYTSVGTPENPQKVLSVSDFDASPGTLATGAKVNVDTSGSGTSVTFAGSWHFYGMEFLGLGTFNNYFAFGGAAVINNIILDNCIIGSSSTNPTSSPTKLGCPDGNGNRTSKVVLNNCEHKVGHTGQAIWLGTGHIELNNFSIGGSIAPTTLFKSGANGTFSNVRICNSDLTGQAWTNLLDVATNPSQIKLTVENCKLPTDANLYTGAFAFDVEITVLNTYIGSTYIRYAKYNYAGAITTETAIVADTNPLTQYNIAVNDKFVSSANSSYSAPLSRAYLIPITTLATEYTPYVEFLVGADGAAALNNNDVFITVEEMIDATTTLGTKVSTYPGLLTAGSAIADGTVTYTGDGYTTERTHRLSAPAYTPTQVGYVRITVNLVKPSTTIHVGVVGVA